MSSKKDILDELTKDELLAWVRNQFYTLPKRSEILYLRWHKQSGDLQRDFTEHAKSLDGLNLAERERLATEFNVTKDPTERLRLIELMEPYGKALQAHMARYKALDTRQKKVDRLYEQMEAEQAKERRR